MDSLNLILVCWVLLKYTTASQFFQGNLKHTNVAGRCVIYVLDNDVFLTYNTGIPNYSNSATLVLFWMWLTLFQIKVHNQNNGIWELGETSPLPLLFSSGILMYFSMKYYVDKASKSERIMQYLIPSLTFLHFDCFSSEGKPSYKISFCCLPSLWYPLSALLFTLNPIACWWEMLPYTIVPFSRARNECGEFFSVGPSNFFWAHLN